MDHASAHALEAHVRAPQTLQAPDVDLVFAISSDAPRGAFEARQSAALPGHDAAGSSVAGPSVCATVVGTPMPATAVVVVDVVDAVDAVGAILDAVDAVDVVDAVMVDVDVDVQLMALVAKLTVEDAVVLVAVDVTLLVDDVLVAEVTVEDAVVLVVVAVTLLVDDVLVVELAVEDVVVLVAVDVVLVVDDVLVVEVTTIAMPSKLRNSTLVPLAASP